MKEKKIESTRAFLKPVNKVLSFSTLRSHIGYLIRDSQHVHSTRKICDEGSHGTLTFSLPSTACNIHTNTVGDTSKSRRIVLQRGPNLKEDNLTLSEFGFTDVVTVDN